MIVTLSASHFFLIRLVIVHPPSLSPELNQGNRQNDDKQNHRFRRGISHSGIDKRLLINAVNHGPRRFFHGTKGGVDKNINQVEHLQAVHELHDNHKEKTRRN